jgi:TonB family protein
MKKTITRIVVLTTICMMCMTAWAENTGLPKGTKAPDIKKDAENNFSISEIKGRTLMITFLDMQAKECTDAAKAVHAIQEEYRKKGTKFAYVIYCNDYSTCRDFAKKMEMKGVEMWGGKDMENSQIAKDYNLTTTPAYCLVDTDGKVDMMTTDLSSIEARMKTMELMKPEVTANDHAPRFPGGMKQLMMFLNKNIKYPEEAAKYGAQGKVVVSFELDKEGVLDNFSVFESHIRCTGRNFEKLDKSVQAFHYTKCKDALEEEAIRVAQKMPNWEPAVKYGKKVKARFKLPVSFKLK